MAEPAPDLIESVVGFRNWRAIDGELRSPHTSVAWTDAMMCARCLGSDPVHDAPDPDCGCGISAYREPQEAFSCVDFRGVTGIVSLWGRLEVHPEHLRAEFARVEALAVNPAWASRQRTTVSAIAYELGVDLIDLREQRGAAWAYGCELQAWPGAVSA